MRPVTRPLATLAVAALPWTVLVVGEVELVFAWGLVTTDPVHAVPLSAYLLEFTAGLPRRLLAWPASVAAYAAAVGSVGVGSLAGREDRRFTAGALAVAGLASLLFALGIARRNPDAVAVPLGTGLLWTLAWWSRPRDRNATDD